MSPVRKLFWHEPYRTSLTTRITAIEGPTIRVAETIFYAFSGGQESDFGTIAGRPVLEARKDGQEIDYTLVSTEGLTVDDPVEMEIDWPRRYRLMRLHFAAELVLELAVRHFSGIEKIGAHIAADKSRIDFLFGESVSPHLPEIRARAQQLVDADLPIRSDFSDAATQRRYWEIDEFARVPCGGTHLKRTGEVGLLALKRDNIGKGKERIVITVA